MPELLHTLRCLCCPAHLQQLLTLLGGVSLLGLGCLLRSFDFFKRR